MELKATYKQLVKLKEILFKLKPQTVIVKCHECNADRKLSANERCAVKNCPLFCSGINNHI